MILSNSRLKRLLNLALKSSLSVLLGLVIVISGCGDQDDPQGGGLHPKVKLGDRVPASNNLTVSNVDDWHQVSTMDTKVPLYRWKIADLLEQKKPFIVVFGTPQHCTMCVDQIVRLAVMNEKYGDDFAFLHVDGYKDTDVWVEWGVTGEPWTYIVDRDGIVVKIYPGQTEIALLEQAVDELLDGA